MTAEEYAKQDAVGLSALVRSAEVSMAEVLEAAVERIAELNPDLNAVVRDWSGELADQVRMGEPPGGKASASAGPLAGVPTLIKDNVALAGRHTSFGSNLLRNNVTATSAPIARRLDQAGLVPLGRSNMCEFGLLPVTESQLWGPARNPWNPDFSTGGSSGGSAAAVAAGLVPVAHGNDGGGSLRIPASCCGVFALKPSRGRNPGADVFPRGGMETAITVNHVLTRSVRDSAAVLDATCGPQPAELFRLPRPAIPFAELVTRDPPRLRIAFTGADFRGREAHPDCIAAVSAMASRLSELGHDVEEAAPELDGEAFTTAFRLEWAKGAGALLLQVRKQMLRGGQLPRGLRWLARPRLGFKAILRAARQNGMPLLEPFTLALAEIDYQHTPGDLLIAERTMQAAEAALALFLTDYDLLLSPVLGGPPMAIGEFDQRWPVAKMVQVLSDYVGFTPIANTGGFPAMSVPSTWNARGLPIGVQFIAPLAREDRLLQLAAQIERAFPWDNRRTALAVGAIA